jgi:hypothetical protein
MPIENDKLSDKIAAKRAGRLATCPTSWKGILSRSWVSTSRKTAIKAFCGECIGFDRQAITDCTAYACPLWHLRPFQTKKHIGDDLCSKPLAKP